MVFFVFGIISFIASIAGAICGIGGGVIIKPLLDSFGILSVSAISFLSGCTVLAMSCYSVGRNAAAKELKVDRMTGLPLAIGGAVGGIVGKELFGQVRAMFDNQNTVGAVQAACLLVLTLGTLIYTIKKDRIQTKEMHSILLCLVIGLALGIFSSFLGIGGGPINLVVLYYFFSMTTKVAAQNSLFIILLSQITSLISTLVTGSVPEVDIRLLIGMILCGILGGIAGRAINKKIDDKTVEKLFIVLMAIIIVINIYNIYRYSH